MRNFVVILALVGWATLPAMADPQKKPKQCKPQEHTQGQTTSSSTAPVDNHGFSPTAPYGTETRWQLPPGMTPQQYQDIQSGKAHYNRQRYVPKNTNPKTSTKNDSGYPSSQPW